MKRKTCPFFQFFLPKPLHEGKNFFAGRKALLYFVPKHCRSEQEMPLASTFKMEGRTPLPPACQVLVSHPTSRQRGYEGVPPSRGIRPRDAGEVDPPPCGRRADDAQKAREIQKSRRVAPCAPGGRAGCAGGPVCIGEKLMT